CSILRKETTIIYQYTVWLFCQCVSPKLYHSEASGFDITGRLETASTQTMSASADEEISNLR
ncbi:MULTISPECIES: hypothetical protein, partial [unclassified Microcoleus]|uniref:hypothetical protein n=1 Tax=unclassified Microcoleus TaxID=2642155 RepID=UPI002FD42820